MVLIFGFVEFEVLASRPGGDVQEIAGNLCGTWGKGQR